jgi:phage pi2 protein 07
MNIKQFYKFILIIIPLLVFACSGPKEKFDARKTIYSPKEYQRMKEIDRDGSFIKDLFMGGKNSSNNTQSANLNVNPFLWKASLDILSSSMPLGSIDSNSGVIISDWYSLKGKPNERVKISVLIDTKKLRADGVNVKIFKQVLKGNSWLSADINANIAINLERKIVQKAGMLSNQKD